MRISDQVRDTVSDYLETASELVGTKEADGLYDVNPDDMSHEELQELKDERLQYTVEYAWENSEFYREQMEEAGVTPDDIDGI
ncbi:MAG: hypothetical protein SV186_06330, partial [Candidatus Nanohaloarchaea archaeon]|nr:hypothetical protein [Candidatus Nanohaloarchaea archaeon]